MSDLGAGIELSKRGIHIQNSYIYILQVQGCRSQQKVISCGDLPISDEMGYSCLIYLRS